MSGTGDLRAVLRTSTDEWLHTDDPMPSDDIDFILAALHAATVPLVSEMECLTPCQKCGPTTDCTGTSRGVWLTEDVLRERLREVDVLRGGSNGLSVRFRLLSTEVDAIVRAVLGGDDA